jgi:ketosteroid isomerase-like protein
MVFSLLVSGLLATVLERDTATIKAAIEAGAKSCMEGRPSDVVRAYAPDITLSYPGIADQDYATILEGYRRLCGSGEGMVERTVPTFEEMLVSGDLAVVRITWTTRLRGAAADRQLRDMQIWRRDKEGWRFSRGVHYPIRTPSQ